MLDKAEKLQEYSLKLIEFYSLKQIQILQYNSRFVFKV